MSKTLSQKDWRKTVAGDRVLAVPALLLFLSLPLAAQEVPQIRVHGGVNLPLTLIQGGTVNSSGMYTLGAEATVTVDWALPFAPLLGVSGILGYDMLPLATGGAVHLPWAAAGLNLNLLSEGLFRLAVHGQGGYSYYLHSTAANSGGAPFATAGLEFSFAFLRAFQLGLSAHYRTAFNRWEALSGTLGLRIALGDTTVRPKGMIQSVEMDSLFPVFLKWYDTNPVGRLRFQNGEKQAARNVRVSLFIKEFMDSPRETPAVASVAAGQSVEIPLFALLSDRILGVTEAMKVPVEIAVSYDAVEPGMKITRTESVRIENRNAMNWADDRRAASFVTPKDPTVLKLSKGLAGRIRSLQTSAYDLNMRIAIALFEALHSYGVNYVVDPASSYAENSAREGVVDYLQFPRQTLEYRSGDCDDLSILYCAVLESVGIETAFITVPGHIFMAFATSVAPADAPKYFSRGDLLFEQDGKLWIPVEITMVGAGFLNAWMRGAQGWIEGGKESRLYPVREAWKAYEAVGLRSEEAALAYPSEGDVLAGFERELSRAIAMEIGPQESRLQAAVAADPSARNHNRLGILYARYGLLEKASDNFRKAAEGGLVSAMHNLGSIAFLMKDFLLAETWYRKALQSDPSQAAARLSLARSLFELGRMNEASAEYAQAARVDPEGAARFAYLKGSEGQGGASRAADAASTQVRPDFLD